MYEEHGDVTLSCGQFIDGSSYLGDSVDILYGKQIRTNRLLKLKTFYGPTE